MTDIDIERLRKAHQSDYYASHWDGCIYAHLRCAVLALIELLKEAQEDLKQLNHGVGLRTSADHRAIKRWQDATGKTMTWPDHADLVVWLIERLEKAEAERDHAQKGFDDIFERHCALL